MVGSYAATQRYWFTQRDGGALNLHKVVLCCFALFLFKECDEGERKKGVEGVCSDTRWNLN